MPVEPKKPYVPPRLIVYGALRVLTLTGGTMGMNDMFGPDKSGF
jgi:hypothetical protein